MLGAGLAPGISSLLARLGAECASPLESVESNVLLSVGDSFGPASRKYLMEEISLRYAVRIDGTEVPMRPFGGSARVDFPPPLGERTAYLLPFSDQVFFPETLGARTAFSRLALDPPWLGALLSALVRLRVTGGARAPSSESSVSQPGSSAGTKGATSTRSSWRCVGGAAGSGPHWPPTARRAGRLSARQLWCTRWQRAK